MSTRVKFRSTFWIAICMERPLRWYDKYTATYTHNNNSCQCRRDPVALVPHPRNPLPLRTTPRSFSPLHVVSSFRCIGGRGSGRRGRHDRSEPRTFNTCRCVQACGLSDHEVMYRREFAISSSPFTQEGDPKSRSKIFRQGLTNRVLPTAPREAALFWREPPVGWSTQSR